MLRAKGEKTVKAIVYPAMSLEKRILLRETLNAAQEPFDVASIIQDLNLLARERKLSLTNRTHIRTLVRDLPERVRAREKDLLLLTEWHPAVVDRIGEHYGPNQEIIGIDQLRSLSRLLDALTKRHPVVLEQMGGNLEVSRILADAFYARRFADDMRSQEGIRKVTKFAKELPENSPHIRRFMNGEIGVRNLQDLAETVENAAEEDNVHAVSDSIVSACQSLAVLLIDLDAESLGEGERRALERTLRVLQSVIST